MFASLRWNLKPWLKIGSPCVLTPGCSDIVVSGHWKMSIERNQAAELHLSRVLLQEKRYRFLGRCGSFDVGGNVISGWKRYSAERPCVFFVSIFGAVYTVTIRWNIETKSSVLKIPTTIFRAHVFRYVGRIARARKIFCRLLFSVYVI